MALTAPPPPQDLQQVMVSGPNLNETSIVSGGYGGTAEGIIPTGAGKGGGPRAPGGGGRAAPGTPVSHALASPSSPRARPPGLAPPSRPSRTASLAPATLRVAQRLHRQPGRRVRRYRPPPPPPRTSPPPRPGPAPAHPPARRLAGAGLHPPHPGPAAAGEEVVRGIAVEKFDIVKKWGINTYKVGPPPGVAAGRGGRLCGSADAPRTRSARSS